MEKLPYFGDTIRARGSAVDSVITRIRSEWSMFRDLVSLLASGGFPVGAKGIYSACARSIKLYEIETWPVKEEDEIRLERNDTDITGSETRTVWAATKNGRKSLVW